MDLRGDIVFCDASHGPYTATLPPPADVGSGYVLTYKKTDASSNAITIAPDGSGTIDGQASVQLTFPYQSVQVATNGANWFLLPVLPSAGGVIGPQSSTDNALALWDGTDGSTLKDSPHTVNTSTGVMTLGGSAPGLASASGVDIAVTPGGSGETVVKNLRTAGTTTVDGAVEGEYDNVGDVTGTATVTAVAYSRIRLTGDTAVALTAPTASTVAAHWLKVVQDGTGSRTPTFTGFTWLGTEPDWASQAAAAETLLGWVVTPDGDSLIWVIKEPS